MIARTSKREELKSCLAIDEDDFDRCIMQHPQLFFSAADELALAIADRDAAKLRLEELTAQVDKDIRDEAIRSEQKLTEVMIQRQLTLVPVIQDATREYADKRLLADRWLALKESFKERSWIIRELGASRIAQMQNLSIEKGSHKVHRNFMDAQAENNYNAASRLRAERRGKDEERRLREEGKL